MIVIKVIIFGERIFALTLVLNDPSLYELNKKLLVREGRMLRMASNSGVSRDAFVEYYLNFNFERFSIGGL